MPQVLALRNHLHRHPELSGHEQATAARLAKEARTLGLQVEEGIGGHGLLCRLDVGATSWIGLRADMDALPIPEQREDAACCSQVADISHACGHDAHSAMLIGAMMVLRQCRDRLDHNIAFIFQPAEETTTGAAAMIADGLLDRCPLERIHALHVNPDLPAGTIGWKAGVMCAAADLFDVEIRGSGGHAARPQHCIDVVLVACQMIQSLLLIPARSVDPLHPAVLTIGHIAGGHAANVIPESVRFSGTVRSLDHEVHALIRAKMDRVIHAVSEQWGASAHFSLNYAAPLLINDDAATALACRQLARWLPETKLVEIAKPSMGGEDFAEFLRRVPGSLLRLGSGGTPESRYPLHHPRFTIDESALSTGVAALAALCLVAL